MCVRAGYTWMLPYHGATVAYIPAANPCTPLQARGTAAPFVNASCNAMSDWGKGRYLATAYGVERGPNIFSISVAGAGKAPNDVLALADGAPSLGMFGNATICPIRSNFTGRCSGLTPTWTPVSATFFSFTVPAATAQTMEQYVVIERMCGGGAADGLCGPPLHAYVRACPTRRCRDVDRYPYPTVGTADTEIAINDVSGVMPLPPTLCYGGLIGSDDCVFYVSVFPQCDSTPGALPGTNCGPPPGVMRLTYSGDMAAEQVPQSCYGLNDTCVLGEFVFVTSFFRALIFLVER